MACATLLLAGAIAIPLHAQPRITSFGPTSGNVGTPVFLSGTNFSVISSNNIVYFGAVRAAVIGATPTNLLVLTPGGATHAPISVTVEGRTALSPAAFLPSFSGTPTNITAMSFAPGQNLNVSDGPHKTILADLDGDGKPDLVEANAYAHTVSVLRNISVVGTLDSGSFAPRIDFAPLGGTDGPRCIAVADLDGDGRLDVLAGDQATGGVWIYQNLASPGSLSAASFAPPLHFPAGGGYPHGLQVGDLNSDGRPEIVLASHGTNALFILENLGTPGMLTTNSFAPVFALPAGPSPTEVAIADLNGDLKPDLVTTAFEGTALSVYRNVATPGSTVSNWFRLDATLPALRNCIEVKTADLDGDGKTDLIAASAQGYAISVFRNQSGPGTFTTNAFSPRVDFSMPGWAHTISVADFNGDAKPDLAVVGELGSYLAVLENRSSPGSFTTNSLAPRVDFPTGWNAWGVAAGDLDGDGRPDIVFANAYDDTLTFYRNVMPQSNTNQPPVDCTATPAGLISWWRGEDSPLDSTGLNHGLPLNGVAFAAGRVGSAFLFDGVNDHIRISDHPSLRVTNALTLEAWVFPTTTGTHDEIISKWDVISGPNQKSYTFSLHPDRRAYLYVSPNGTDNLADSVFSTTHVPLNEWTHLAATYDGNRLNMYVNGVLEGFTPYDRGIFPGTNALAVGGYVGAAAPGQVGSPFAGRIDEAALYHRALAAGEITAIYAAGSAGKCDTNPPLAVPPQITHQPQSITTNAGAIARFEVAATGIPSPTYQWFFNTNALPGQTSASLQLAAVQPQHAGEYFVVASNSSGAVTSSIATLTVLTFPPAITKQPINLSVTEGATATFSVQASGTTPIAHQWFFQGSSLLGKTSPTLTLNNIQATNSGNYFIVVSNAYGRATSEVATLTVLPVPNCSPAPAGLVAWWPGESNVWDVIGNHDAILSLSQPPSYLLYATGKVGTAFNFQIQGRALIAPPAPALNLGLGDGLTFETWIYRQPGSSGIIFGWGGTFQNQSPAPLGVRLQSVSSGALIATLVQTNYQITTLQTAVPVLASNVWQHLALTWDRTSRRATIYVDAVAVGEITIPASQIPLALQTTGIFSLGYLGGFAPLVGARLDEPSLYNRALSAAEVQSIYQAQQSGKCPPPPVQCINPAADLVGWWRGESNVLDSAGFSHGVMVPTNMPSQFGYGPGLDGAAFSLRTGNHVLISNTPAINVGAGAGLSVEIWYNSMTPTMPLVEWNSGMGTQGVHLAHSFTRGPNYLEANFVDTHGQSHVMSSPSLPVVFGQWRHVAISYDKTSGAALMLVDGALVTQTNLGSFTPRTTGNLYLGYRPPGNYPGSGARLNGLMDEVAVYQRALSAEELRCLMRAGVAGKLPPPNDCVFPTDSMVSWWRGESNALDSISSNHGNFGIISQAYTNGQVGLAFATDLRRYISIPAAPSMNVGAGAGFTVEGWINPAAPPQNFGNVFGWRGIINPTRRSGVSLEHNVIGAGSLRVNLISTNGPDRFFTAPSGTVKTGQWQHVALSYDRASGSAALYVNGAQVSSTNFGSYTPDTTGNFYLGSGPSGGYFIGGLDEFAVHKRALSPLEIAAIARATNGRCTGSGPTIVQQPASQRVNPGTTVTFSVVAAGPQPLSYQWFFRAPDSPNYPQGQTNIALVGFTNQTLTRTNVNTKDAGFYWVRVTNQSGATISSEAHLTINVPPSATSRFISLLEDSSTNIVLTAFDSNKDALSFVIQQLPQHGSLTGSSSNYLYTPNVNYFGPDQFTFIASDGLASSQPATISLTVLPVNDPPVAYSQSVTTDEDTPIAVTLEVSDADGDVLQFNLSSPSHGALSGTPPNLTYTPAADFFGEDVFTYTVKDPSNAGSALAAVSITVRPVNDAPVARIEISPQDELPGVTNQALIAPVCCLATVRLDGSQSTDVERTPLSYAWLVGTNVLGTDAVITNYFPPGSWTIQLLVSDGTNVTSAVSTLEIISPAEAIEFAADLVTEGIRDRRDRMVLLNWLHEAEKSFERCHVSQGVRFLEMFKERVGDRITPKDPQLANALNQIATALIEAAPDCDPCHRLGRPKSKRDRDDRDSRRRGPQPHFTPEEEAAILEIERARSNGNSGTPSPGVLPPPPPSPSLRP